MLVGFVQFIKSLLVDINLRQCQALVSKHIDYFFCCCFLSTMAERQSHTLSYTKVYFLSMFTCCLTFQWGQIRGKIGRSLSVCTKKMADNICTLVACVCKPKEVKIIMNTVQLHWNLVELTMLYLLKFVSVIGILVQSFSCGFTDILRKHTKPYQVPAPLQTQSENAWAYHLSSRWPCFWPSVQ